MDAQKMELLDRRRLAQGRLGTWRYLAKCALRPKAVTASVQRMAKRIEDREAERDRLALRLALRLVD